MAIMMYFTVVWTTWKKVAIDSNMPAVVMHC